MRTRTACLLILLLLPFAAHGEERWYVFSMGDTPVGYLVEEWDGLRTRTETFARLTRLGKSIEMRFETTAIETAEGDLKSLVYEATMSKQPARVEAVVEGDRIRIGTPPHERTIDRGAARILGPRAVARLSGAKLRKKGDVVEFAVFSPELQRVARVKRTVLEVGAKRKVEEVIEGVPATRTVWLGEDGVAVADSIPGPFGAMSTRLATREVALAANGTLPDDVYERTLARANIRFADPFAVDRIVLRVTRTDATQPLPDLATHNQRVLRRDEDSVTVEVRRDGGAATVAGEFLKPNALVESNHPDIVKIARELTRASAGETAHELTRWVAENMSMDAGIVMAPASELIRDRKATCMGYATLLAALGRAAGIPSRIVMGLVYYGGIWGGHAWTEMIVDGRWVPLDAAVYSPGTANAARLAAGASSFADGGGDLYGAVGSLFGRVDVDVLEYDAGRTVRLAADSPPYRIEDSAYVNPGLGLRVPAKDWAIEKADATWPSTLIVAFRRGANVVELHHRPRNPDRPLKREGDAMFVDTRGGMLWVWTARGPEAARSLRQFLD